MCPEREFRDASGWIQTRVAFSGHTFAGVLPMPHGPWMRIAIAAAGLAALCITMRPAIAREPEKGSDTGQPPVARSYGQYLVERTRTRHPELIGLDLHATPPNAPRSVVIASLDRDRVGRVSCVHGPHPLKISRADVGVDLIRHDSLLDFGSKAPGVLSRTCSRLTAARLRTRRLIGRGGRDLRRAAMFMRVLLF